MARSKTIRDQALDERFLQFLNEYYKETGMTHKAIAFKLDTNQQQIHYVRNGLRPPTLAMINAAVRNCSLNPNWLYFGQGDKYLYL